jgi:flagellar assembly protein FliH
MSFNAWHPRVVTGRTNQAGKRAARIVAPEGEALAKPMEWREVGAASVGAGAKATQDSPDMSVQMQQLRQQCERQVKEAHAAGLREAESAAKTRAAAEVQGVIEKLGQSIAELSQMRVRLRKQAEADTIKLSLAIAKRVLRREVAVDPDAMRGLLIAALEKLQTQEIHRVRASTGQAAAIAATLRQAVAHAKIEVMPDGTLAPGGVVFETNQGNLDASVDSQLQEIERGLADHLRKQS